MSDCDCRVIPGLYWTKDTLVGKVKITTEPTPLRVGTENLAGRKYDTHGTHTCYLLPELS